MAMARAQRSTPVAAAALALLMAGCSGTPFGDRLAGSFSGAPQTPSTPAAKPATAPATAPESSSAAKPTAPAQPPSATAATSTPPSPRAVPLTPAPYRITIKLPAADPSAPAELVTEALRQAGVPFEVEMIERVSGTPAAPSLPTPAPAPAPRPR